MLRILYTQGIPQGSPGVLLCQSPILLQSPELCYELADFLWGTPIQGRFCLAPLASLYRKYLKKSSRKFLMLHMSLTVQVQYQQYGIPAPQNRVTHNIKVVVRWFDLQKCRKLHTSNYINRWSQLLNAGAQTTLGPSGFGKLCDWAQCNLYSLFG